MTGGRARKQSAAHGFTRSHAPSLPLPRFPPSPLFAQERGSIIVKVTFIPFFQPVVDDEGGDESKHQQEARKKRQAMLMPNTRVVTSSVNDKMKVKGGVGEAGERGCLWLCNPLTLSFPPHALHTPLTRPLCLPACLPLIRAC